MQGIFNNLAEEISFFSPNSALNVKIEEIHSGQKIIIIDNFYMNPEKVQKLALSIPPTYNPSIVAGVPGGRVDASYYLGFLSNLFNQLINDVYYKDTRDYDCTCLVEKSTFCVNLINDTTELAAQCPHIDGTEGFAAGIFLNSPESCTGGTSFYTYKGDITPSHYPDDDLNPNNYPEYITDDYKDFKKIYTAEMRFNRLILYKRNMLHTAYITKNSFTKDSPRLMQMFFI